MKKTEQEPMVSVYLSTENGPFVEGAINGTNFRIRTGEIVQIPERIAAVLEGSRLAVLAGEARVKAFAAAGGKEL